jgi:hypothetical protein
VQTVADASGYYIYSVGGKNYATITGINPKRVSWSYLFYRYPVELSQYDTFISYLSKGDLIDEMVDTINTIIASNELSGYCDCSVAYSIGQKINSAYKFQLWNVVCEASLNTVSQIVAWSKWWIYTKPKQCYFTVWANNFN